MDFIISEYTGQLGRVLNTTDTHLETEWEDGTKTAERLDGEGEHWRGCLTRSTAEECLKVAQEFVTRVYGEGWKLKLYEPGHEGNFWNISLELSGEWAYDVTVDPSVQWPKGVFAEPVAMWCLGLYPA